MADDNERMSLLEEAHRQHRADLADLKATIKSLSASLGRTLQPNERPVLDRLRALENQYLNRTINGVEMHRLERVLHAIAVALQEDDE